MSSSKHAHLSSQQIEGLLAAITVPSSKARFTNWAHTYACKPLALFEPVDEYQCELIVELARREGKIVRASGVGHSPSDLACTSGYMIRINKLNKLLEANYDKRYIVAQPGITLTELHGAIAAHNLALTSLGSISEQTMGGTVVIVNHGSGLTYGVLSTHVMSLDMLLADGSRVRCSRQEHPDLFNATICGLGSTGLILRIQFEVEPAFRLKDVRYALHFNDLTRGFYELVPASQHSRFWWFPQDNMVEVSMANRTSEPKKRLATTFLNTLIGYHLVQFLLFLGLYRGIFNVWAGRLASYLIQTRTVAVDDSHRIFNVEHRYWQYTIEYAIPYERVVPCLKELRNWLDQEHADPDGLRPHFPIEIRFSEADDILLSPSYGRRTCWLGIAQYKPYGLDVPYATLFDRYGEILHKYGGRPHWAKAHHSTPEELRELYPKFDEFVAALEKWDPHGMFRNEYVERHIFGKRGTQYDEMVFESLPTATEICTHLL